MVVGLGLLMLYGAVQPDHEPPEDLVTAALTCFMSTAMILSFVGWAKASRRDTSANLDRLDGRCFKCEAELEPNLDDCPQCGAWLPIQRLYEEYLRTRYVQYQKASTRVPALGR